MSAVYKTLAKEVLPELRRARFIANVEFTNYTSEELVELINSNIDVLDEEALLRAATLVKENDKKVAVYKKAIEKFNSPRAQYNLAVTYINMDDLAKAKAELAKVEKDADVYNAYGVIALREGDNKTAADNFAKAKNEASVENAAVLDILAGDYKAAAQKLSGKKTFNAVLAQILVGNNAAISSLECTCAKSSYLRAVAAARQGNAATVKAELEKVNKNEKLAQRAAKDVEFAQFR